MSTVKLTKGIKDVKGWPEVAKSLESIMDKKGLEGWNVFIFPSPLKDPYCYRAEIFREEKTFIVTHPPISLADPKIEAEMVAGKILEKFLPLQRGQGLQL